MTPTPKMKIQVARIWIGAVRAVTAKAIPGRPAPIQEALMGMVTAKKIRDGAAARA